MFRLFQVNRPDSGLDNVSYQESAYPFSAILTKKITSSINIVKTNAFDGVGRLTQSRLTSDPQGIVYANTSYDALGHVSATSNPYRSTSESTYGVTTALYDAIGRVCVVIPPDGSSVSGTCPGTPPSNDILTSHSGNITTVVDQAGKQRRSVTDGLGRLVEVDEPNPGAAATLATGNIAISGSEQSATSQAAASGTGSVTINGTVQSVQICVRTTCHLLYDTGTVTISVNGFSKSVSYGQTSTGNTLASALAAAFNGDGNSPVNAGPSNNIVMLTAKATGASTNYSLSSSSGTSDTSCTNFCGPSFTTSNSGSTLTGGHNASTISDSGSVTITVNGTPYTSTYGSADTTTTIAASLANQVNAGAFASASASGPMVSLTSKTSGTSGNYSLAASYTYNTSQFAQPSFTTSTSGSTLSGGRDANALNNSPFVTLYAYDALSNLTCVVQKGVDTTAFTSCASAPLAWRPRSFVYDSLSHLRSASNPEAGTIAYTYDNDGKVLTKTDARGIQTTFSYDSLDRITGKTYSNGDPSVGYTYDAAACLGASACSNIGRRTGMTDAAGSESWSYDAMGRPLADQRTTNGTPKTTSYTYNLDGSLATLSYLSGRTITYTPNSAGRIVSAIDSANSISYATNALYAPQGSLTSFQNGSSIVSTFYFNNRLQPCRISVKNTGNVPGSCIDSANIGNILDYTYNFSLGASDNGNVSAITNNRDNTRSQNFTYDALNRLASAQTQTTGVTIPNSNCWGLNYGYDAWGNLLYGTFTGPSGCGQPMPLNVSATTSNQIPGYCYDVAGNLLDQGTCPTTGSHTYSYNAENQMVSAAGVSYLYDGDGKRVQKSNGKLYWYGMGSDPLDETDASGNLLEEYIFFNGKRIARRDSSNTVMYYFGDHLGTSRVTTSATGTVLDDSDFYPFGGERAITSSSGNGYKFTGKERDAESGLDEFGARYYSSVIGRFTSPDWSASPEAVPYVNLTNPQTLNLYGYVKNNPLSTTDPDGHCPACVIYVEELITSPEGQAILDNAIGITVAGAAAGYAGAKGWFDKAADFIIQQPFDDPTLTGYKSLHTLTDDAFQQPLQKSDQQVNEEVKQEAGGKCEYCGATTQDAQKSQKGVTPPGNEGQTDHYKPTSRGGSNEKGNKVHACRGCNRAKSDADPTNPNDAAGRKWQLDRMKDRKPPKDKPIRPQAEGLQ